MDLLDLIEEKNGFCSDKRLAKSDKINMAPKAKLVFFSVPRII